jgi:hypothetical protein
MRDNQPIGQTFGPRSKLDKVIDLNDRGRRFLELIVDGADIYQAGKEVGWKRKSSCRALCRSPAFKRAYDEAMARKAQQNG